MSLPRSHTQWKGHIEASLDTLFDPANLKTIQDALGKSVSRTPQRILWQCISEHIKQVAEDDRGISVLTALIAFGTRKTVDEIVDKLYNPKFASLPLLETLAKRVDCESESRTKLLAVGVSVALQNPTAVEARCFLKALHADTAFERGWIRKLLASKMISGFDPCAQMVLAEMLDAAADSELSSFVLKTATTDFFRRLNKPLQRACLKNGSQTVVDKFCRVAQSAEFNLGNADCFALMLGRASSSVAEVFAKWCVANIADWAALVSSPRPSTLRFLVALGTFSHRVSLPGDCARVIGTAADLLARVTGRMTDDLVTTNPHLSVLPSQKRLRPLVEVAE